MKSIRSSLTDTQLLILFAICGTSIHILLNGQYGFHRDELDIIMKAWNSHNKINPIEKRK